MDVGTTADVLTLAVYVFGDALLKFVVSEGLKFIITELLPAVTPVTVIDDEAPDVVDVTVLLVGDTVATDVVPLTALTVPDALAALPLEIVAIKVLLCPVATEPLASLNVIKVLLYLYYM